MGTAPTPLPGADREQHRRRGGSSYRRRQTALLRLSFHGGQGDPPTLMLAKFVRFCADGCLRGPDNYVVAQCVEGLWKVSGRAHRELDCEGPVRVRVVSRLGEPAIQHGPFQHLRTVAGVLHADDSCLQICMPGRTSEYAASCHEISFLP